MGRFNLATRRMLEAISQITGHNRHLCKSPQRIMVRIFKLVKAAEVKNTKFLRRSNKILKPQTTKMDSYIASNSLRGMY